MTNKKSEEAPNAIEKLNIFVEKADNWKQRLDEQTKTETITFILYNFIHVFSLPHPNPNAFHEFIQSKSSIFLQPLSKILYQASSKNFPQEFYQET